MAEKLALELKDVVFRYLENGKRNILDHVDLAIPAGTITVLMGSSGCGKSTLAAVAAGLYPENGGFLERGEIALYGQDLRQLDPQKRAQYLTVLFQNPDLQFCMGTLRKEMQFCLENICVPPGGNGARIGRTAEEFGIAALLDRPLSRLSGGEKQKANLACLYAMESRCILLDECFANIDAASSAEIMRHLMRIRKAGRTIIAIDHQLQLWIDYADEVIILSPGGKPVQRGITKQNLAEHLPLFEEHGLFYPQQRAQRALNHSGGEEALRFHNLTIRPEEGEKKGLFHKAPQTPALLEEAEAIFPKHCMTAVLGPSGSGKTTTFLSVLKQHPYSGEIFLGGKDISEIKPKELYRQVGIVFQNPANQFITQNVKEEVTASLKLWQKELSEEKAEELTLELLKKYQLELYPRYSPYMLSQGQQRRLAVLSVLTGGQKLLLLDEPTYGQDYRSALAIMTHLRQRIEQEGLTVIFITHDEALARRTADKIYRLENRKLKEVLTGEEREAPHEN